MGVVPTFEEARPGKRTRRLLRLLLAGASLLMAATPSAADGIELDSGNVLHVASIEFSRFLPQAFYDQAMASLPRLYPDHVLLAGRRWGVIGGVEYALLCFRRTSAGDRIVIQGVAVYGGRAWRIETLAPFAYGTTLMQVLEQMAKLSLRPDMPEPAGANDTDTPAVR